MSTEDQYPSTSDCARICGAQDDLVYLCLVNARERVEKGHTVDEYIAVGGGVCAIGAVLAATGWDTGEVRLQVDYSARCGHALMEKIEDELRSEAKEAIALLNAATLALHPEAADFENWSGPLEWVNQAWRSTMNDYDEDAYYDEDGDLLDKEQGVKMVKAEILRIYDHAIAERAGEPVPA
jgi:hypothetical protein